MLSLSGSVLEVDDLIKMCRGSFSCLLFSGILQNWFYSFFKCLTKITSETICVWRVLVSKVLNDKNSNYLNL